MGTLTFTSVTARAQSADELAGRLAELRAEVEGMSEELAASKSDTRNELESLARQRSDLEVELDREAVRIKKLRATLERKREQVRASSSESEELAPILDSALDGLRGHIETSIPFRRAERIEALEQIRDQRRTGVISYPRALVRVWSLVEDELRMTRESALYEQTISVNGEEKLSDVVRIGMVMLFFKTSSGQVGHAARTGDDWRFVVAGGERERERVHELFDSFARQIRVGLFRIPNALPQDAD